MKINWWYVLSGVILCYFLVIGLFWSSIIIHEAYHAATLKGDRIGLCLGECVSNNKTYYGFVKWRLMNDTAYEFEGEYSMLNESHAQLAGPIITAILFVIMILYPLNKFLDSLEAKKRKI